MTEFERAKTMSLPEIFAALDELGVPDDLLSPAERAQEAPRERPELNLGDRG